MVFCSDGEPLVGWIYAGAFRDSPTQKDAVKFQAEIVMQARRVVLLDKVGELFFAGVHPAGRRFGRLLEIAFAAVFFERHGNLDEELPSFGGAI